MPTLIVVLRAGLGLVLLTAGGAKLGDTSSFRTAVGLFAANRMPRAVVTVVAVGIAIGECAVGIAVFALPAVQALDGVMVVLFAIFVAVSSYGYVVHKGESCRCFGRLSERTFDRSAVARSVLLACAALVVVLGRGAPLLQMVRLTWAFTFSLLATGLLLAATTMLAAHILALIAENRPRLLS